MTKTVKEKNHGTVIEIQIRVDRLSHLEHAFGGWRDDPELDQAFDQIDLDRHAHPCA